MNDSSKLWRGSGHMLRLAIRLFLSRKKRKSRWRWIVKGVLAAERRIRWIRRVECLFRGLGRSWCVVLYFPFCVVVFAFAFVHFRSCYRFDVVIDVEVSDYSRSIVVLVGSEGWRQRPLGTPGPVSSLFPWTWLQRMLDCMLFRASMACQAPHPVSVSPS